MTNTQNRKRAALRLALLLLLFALAALSAGLAEDYVTVRDTGTLNVRSGPSTDYAKVGEMRRGDWAQVLGESGNWYYLRTVKDGITGYASKNFLTGSAGGGTAGGTMGVVNNPKPTQFLRFNCQAPICRHCTFSPSVPQSFVQHISRRKVNP